MPTEMRWVIAIAFWLGIALALTYWFRKELLRRESFKRFAKSVRGYFTWEYAAILGGVILVFLVATALFGEQLRQIVTQIGNRWP